MSIGVIIWADLRCPRGTNTQEERKLEKVPTMAERLAEQRRLDQEEAAALQAWLVGNARHHRPAGHTGLFAWALAALKAQAAK